MTAQNPVHRTARLVSRLPSALRWTIVAAGIAVLFALALSPSDSAPSITQADKVQHALGFLVLTLAYGLLFPDRRAVVTAGVVALGVAVEVLQALMPFGRHAEIGDLIADGVGIVLGLMLLRLLAGPAKRPT
jgi:VanZ family protein